MGKLNFKKGTGAFPSSGLTTDALYFSVDSTNKTLEMGLALNSTTLALLNATTADRLNTSAGGELNPVYFKNGIPVACAASSSTNRWGIIPAVDANGDMYIGDKILFYTTDAGTAGPTITATTTGLTLSGTTSGTFSGSLSGNASTATKWKTARTLSWTGDATGSMSVDGSTDKSTALTLSSTGVTAGTYGAAANKTLAHGDTFNVPQFTVDAKGRLSKAVTYTFTLPSISSLTIKQNQGTETVGSESLITTYDTTSAKTITINAAKARQGVFYIENGTFETAADASNNEYCLWKGEHEDITELYSGLMIMYKIPGNISASHKVWLQLNDFTEIQVVRDVSTAIDNEYAANEMALLIYTTDNGIPYWKFVTAYDSNTKTTTNSTNTSKKIYLVGGLTQGSSVTTYSHDTAYVGTDGHLYSNSKQVVNLSDTQALTNKTYNGYTLAAACAKGVTDSSSASAISSTGTSLPTERDIYYGLPTINGAHNYTSETTLWAPTSSGSDGQILIAKSNAAPIWTAPSSLSVGEADKVKNSIGWSFNGTEDSFDGSEEKNIGTWYAPTTAGTAGYILRAVANSAPKWDVLNTFTATLNGTSIVYNGIGDKSISWYAPATSGSDGQILVAKKSAAPEWTAPSSITVGTASKVANALKLTLNGGTTVSYDGSGEKSVSWYAPTAVGTKNQILISSGSGAPTWGGLQNLTATVNESKKTYNGTEAIDLGAWYAPTTAGSEGQVLVSAGATDKVPEWLAQSSIAAGTASKLATARTISLSGDVSGSGTFDGSGDLNIVATVLDNSHNHDYLPLTGGTLSGDLVLDSNTTTHSAFPAISWGGIGSATPFIGYADDQSDGTFLLMSLAGSSSYRNGLAIGGSSGNLLWKGLKVLTTEDMYFSGGVAAANDAKVVGGVTASTHEIVVEQKEIKAGTNIKITGGTTAITVALNDTISVTNGGTGTNIAPTQGGIIYGASTSKYASTAAGTSGYLLKSNGTSAPTWISQTSINAGTADALKLEDAVGSANNPVYFNAGGTPTACDYSFSNDTIDLTATDGNKITPTVQAVRNAINASFAANDAMVFKGVIATESELPTNGYSAGWTYKINYSGEYAGQQADAGDMIVAITDGPTSGTTLTDAHWMVIQSNVDGPVFTGTQQGVGTDGLTILQVDTAGKITESTQTVGSSTLPIYLNNGTVTVCNSTLDVSISGNAATTTKLKTARTINGTSFNGTSNITTTQWGTARNIYIASSDGTNASAAVSVNGSADTTLLLPNTITATLKGSVEGNATTATTLQTARTIGIGTGATGTATSFDGSKNITIPITDVKEAYLSWGGRMLAGTVSPVDAACSNIHSANRFAFANANGITVEYSQDGGSTYTDYGASSNDKKALVSGIGTNFYIGKRNGAGVNTASDVVRITLNATSMGVYTRLQKVLIHITTNYAKGSHVVVEKAMKGSTTTFTTIGDYNISGWSGWNSIPIGAAFGGGDTQTSNIAILRFTFKITGVDSNTSRNSALTVKDIVAIGDTYWAYPSQMALTGHLYGYDVEQNATFPSNISANGNITANGSMTATAFNGNASSATNGVWYVTGNTSGTAGTWTGSNTSIPNLFTGLTIAYKVGIAGASTTTLNLTTAAGASGAKTIKRNNSNLTTHIPVNSVILLTYDGTYWRWADYNANTTYTAGTGLTLSSTTFSLAAVSGLTAGNYGPADAVSPAHGGTFNVPYITVDAYGRITGIQSQVITLPEDNNTDTKVTQDYSTASGQYPLLFSATNDITSITSREATTAIVNNGIYAEPSVGRIVADRLAATTNLALGSTDTSIFEVNVTGSQINVNSTVDVTSPFLYYKFEEGAGAMYGQNEEFSLGKSDSKWKNIYSKDANIDNVITNEVTLYNSNTRGASLVSSSSMSANYTLTAYLEEAGNIAYLPTGNNKHTSANNKPVYVTENGMIKQCSGTLDVSISGNAITATTAAALSSKNVGSTSIPVYIDAKGQPQACTSISLKAATAETADKVAKALSINGQSYNGSTAIDVGTIGITYGGTGTNTAPTQGGIIYAASTSQYASTAAGASGQILKSNGTSAPQWINQSSITAGAAAKLTVSDTGGELIPTYFKDGVPKICAMTGSTNGYHSALPWIDNNGIMDVGSTINFHSADAATTGAQIIYNSTNNCIDFIFA